jgi:hypothetical protein
MGEDESVTGRLRLDYALETSPELLDRLLEDPRSVLDAVGVDESALVCTDEAHKSLGRSQEIAERANALGEADVAETLPRLREVIQEGFGPNVRTMKVPFGIRFMERVEGVRGMELTGTGTVECTFGLECKGDVDG